jgi:hypothetical protein
MKRAQTFVAGTFLSWWLVPGCGAFSTLPTATDDGGTDVGVLDGAPTPRDSAAEASPYQDGRTSTLGVECNLSPACDSPQECCVPNIAHLGYGVCVALGTCQGISFGCQYSKACPGQQICCLTTNASACQDGPCPQGTSQLCDPSYQAAGLSPPECLSGGTCSARCSSNGACSASGGYCVFSDAGAADANQDASSDADGPD